MSMNKSKMSKVHFVIKADAKKLAWVLLMASCQQEEVGESLKISHQFAELKAIHFTN